MSEHESIRELLALAAADALDAEQRRRVDAHTAQCEFCRRELAAFDALAGTLRRAPMPQPSPELLARVHVLASARLAVVRNQSEVSRWLPALVLASWVSALASWPLVSSALGEIGRWFSIQQVGALQWALNNMVLGGTLLALTVTAILVQMKMARGAR